MIKRMKNKKIIEILYYINVQSVYWK